MDYDYADKLPEEARVWLAAFSEEFYRGWRLSKETQLHSPSALREADAARKRATRALGDGAQLVELGAELALPAVALTEAELVAAIDRRRQQAAPRGVTWEAMLASFRSNTW